MISHNNNMNVFSISVNLHVHVQCVCVCVCLCVRFRVSMVFVSKAASNVTKTTLSMTNGRYKSYKMKTNE